MTKDDFCTSMEMYLKNEHLFRLWLINLYQHFERQIPRIDIKKAKSIGSSFAQFLVTAQIRSKYHRNNATRTNKYNVFFSVFVRL